MKSPRSLRAFALLAAGMAISTAPLRAQAITAPIIVKTITSLGGSNPGSSTSNNTASGTKILLLADVIHADSHTITVSERGNERMVHTFSFAPALQPKMQKIMDGGGYQYGDKVKILYVQGQTVALRIHGKPSKPL